MKKTLLLGALGVATLGNAQTFTQANEPASGESQTMFLCDSNAVAHESVTGSGVTWDYSNLAGYAGETRSLSIEDASSSASASDYPNSDKVLAMGTQMSTFFSSDASIRESQGFIFTEPTFGDVKAIYDNNGVQVMTYPFAISNELDASYSGTLSTAAGDFPMTGKMYTTFDGQGSLNLPNGVNLTDVSRYVTIDSVEADAGFIGTVNVVRAQYEYYNLTTSNLPVLIVTKLDVQGAISMQTGLTLSMYEGFLSTNELDELSFSMAPNPANEEFKISGDFNTAEVAIVDMKGAVVKMVTVSSNEHINIADLDAGIYTVKVIADNKMSTQKLIKK